jgi:hypothetical protein
VTRAGWSNRQVAMLLMACAAGLYAASVVIILVRG